MNFRSIFKNNKRLKVFALWLLLIPNQARPRWWVKLFVNPIFHKRSIHSIIRYKARLDLVPFVGFELGSNSVIEEYVTLNNGLGEIKIGQNTTIGIGNILIGPLTIGNNVIMAQYVVVSALNHGFENPEIPIRFQPCNTSLIKIEDDCWIGSNSIILSGVEIGKHSIVAAGSVVTKSVPSFSLVGGNPARLIKQYDFDTKTWIKV